MKGKFKEQLEKKKTYIQWNNDTNDSWFLITNNGDKNKMK